MTNLVDALLAADANQITQKEITTVEIPRLTKIVGVPFIVTLQAVSPKRLDEIQEQAIKMTKKGRYAGTDLTTLRRLTLCESIIEPDLKNKKLQEKFGVVSPKELISKLFSAGEIQNLYEKSQQVSGFTEENEEEYKEEIKN